MHAIVGLEEFPGERDQFAVARVIQRLNAGNTRRQSRMRLPDVVRQFGFGVRRPGDEDCPGVAQCRGYELEELLVDGRMAAVAGIGLVMNVLIGM